MSLREIYGRTALIAGGSEGMGAAFAKHAASQGMDVVIVARRLEKLEATAKEIKKEYQVEVVPISCDLADPQAAQKIKAKLGERSINLVVYNAALSHIGRFEESELAYQNKILGVNVVSPVNFAYTFGESMLKDRKGAFVFMASIAGQQGSAYLSTYAATKSFNQVFAEGLWYEWREQGVDVIACLAGATKTPNYINSQAQKVAVIKPQEQSPEVVVKECFQKLGKRPFVITGIGNKLASFIMHRVLPRKWAIQIISRTTRKMYRIQAK